MKKVLVIFIGTVIMGALFICCHGAHSNGEKKGGAKETSDQTPSAASPSNTNQIGAHVEAVDIYVDASGSMKGYIDGVQGKLKEVVPLLIPNLTNCDRMGLCKENIKCYTIYNKKPKLKDTDTFGPSITNASIFNGQSTEVHEMFKVVADEVVNNPNHVGIIVSDCILSFSGNELKNNKEKNYNDIAVLRTEVTQAMTVLYNKGMNVCIVKYTSDFNGNYYYDYHNQKLSSAKNQTMKKRPFYLVLVGKRELVDAMFNKEVIPNGYEAVFSFNKEGAKPEYRFLRASKASSWVPEIEGNIPTISTKVKANKNINAAYVYLEIGDFELPSYLDSKRDLIMSSPKSDGKYIASVSRVKQADIENAKDLIAVKGKTPDLTGKNIYKVIFKNNDHLKNLTDFKDRIYFEAPTMNALSSEIEKDDANSIGSLQDLEGKTFMFNHLIDGLRAAYSGGGAPLAEIEITIKTN